jgi:hypothetical protein
MDIETRIILLCLVIGIGVGGFCFMIISTFNQFGMMVYPQPTWAGSAFIAGVSYGFGLIISQTKKSRKLFEEYRRGA